MSLRAPISTSFFGSRTVREFEKRLRLIAPALGPNGLNGKSPVGGRSRFTSASSKSRNVFCSRAARKRRSLSGELGIARWERPEESIDVPMIERGVEIEIADQSDAAITIRPRSSTAHVELRPFEKLSAEKLVIAEDTARRCLRGIETGDGDSVSPFKRETFEPILKICGSQLDPEGRYLPDHRLLPETEPVPSAEGRQFSRYRPLCPVRATPRG